MSHFVLECEEFAMDRGRLLAESVRVGAEKWLGEYNNGDEENGSIAVEKDAG